MPSKKVAKAPKIKPGARLTVRSAKLAEMEGPMLASKAKRKLMTHEGPTLATHEGPVLASKAKRKLMTHEGPVLATKGGSKLMTHEGPVLATETRKLKSRAVPK